MNIFTHMFKSISESYPSGDGDITNFAQMVYFVSKMGKMYIFDFQNRSFPSIKWALTFPSPQDVSKGQETIIQF